MLVYKITNAVNGKIYVGLTTKSIEARFRSHIHDSIYNKKPTAILRAIRKYGKENFSIEELQKYTSLEELGKGEYWWIRNLKTLSPSGYNLKDGGHSGWTYTLEVLEKMREAHSGSKNGFYGQTHRPDSIFRGNESRKKWYDSLSQQDRMSISKKISISQLGKKASDQTKLNAKIGFLKSIENRPFYLKDANGEIWRLKGRRAFCAAVGFNYEILKQVLGSSRESWGISSPSQEEIESAKFINIAGYPKLQSPLVIFPKQRKYIKDEWKLFRVNNPITKISNASKARSISNKEKYLVKKSNNPYYAKDPNGMIHKIADLAEFCRVNNLVKPSFIQILNGRRKINKGWTKPTMEEIKRLNLISQDRVLDLNFKGN